MDTPLGSGSIGARTARGCPLPPASPWAPRSDRPVPASLLPATRPWRRHTRSGPRPPRPRDPERSPHTPAPLPKPQPRSVPAGDWDLERWETPRPTGPTCFSRCHLRTFPERQPRRLSVPSCPQRSPRAPSRPSQPCLNLQISGGPFRPLDQAQSPPGRPPHTSRWSGGWGPQPASAR